VQKKRDLLPIWKEVSLLCTIYKNDRKVKKKVKKVVDRREEEVIRYQSRQRDANTE